MVQKKGIWFYGLSGSGKSFASELLSKKIKHSCLIDGDVVRKYISYDLKYSKKDRNIQLYRMLGISKIAIESNIFPIISTVWMNKKILVESKKVGIKVIKIETDINNLINTHKTYKNKKDVVGINLRYSRNLITETIINNKDKEYWKTLKKLIQ
tara:strand:- start:354 stop:815 length:462 start_codon:yes stop_codon:yes gene_type:complete